MVGPPGVGKTSLGKLLLQLTDIYKNVFRRSKGWGEIRGIETYIVPLPGYPNDEKAGTKNPLFLLDEVDKIGNDYRGDPSSALLEALDPEQNTTFNDHYLEVDYDLSDDVCYNGKYIKHSTTFIRQNEVIRIPGYTEDEKSI